MTFIKFNQQIRFVVEGGRKDDELLLTENFKPDRKETPYIYIDEPKAHAKKLVRKNQSTTYGAGTPQNVQSRRNGKVTKLRASWSDSKIKD